MDISGRTRIVGIFGDPVEHSLSPSMHNAAFRSLGLDYAYVPFHVSRSGLGIALKGLFALDIKGVNLTIPHKVDALKYLSWRDREVKLIGAVNTVKVNAGGLFGYNTDGKGFILSLKKDCNFNPRKKNVLILGAGGAARAVVIKLASCGAGEITVTSPIKQELKQLAGDVKKRLGINIRTFLLGRSVPVAEAVRIHLLVNTTPVGMHADDPVLLPCEFFKKAGSLQLVYDVIYSPAKTRLLRTAASCGIQTSNGLGMLLYQGALAFEIWTGRQAPVDIMRKALLKTLGNG